MNIKTKSEKFSKQLDKIRANDELALKLVQTGAFKVDCLTGNIEACIFGTLVPVKTIIDKAGYERTDFNFKGKNIRLRVHRLVLIAHFLAIPEYPKFESEHLDGNRSNNSILNLKWATRSENVRSAMARGTWTQLRSERKLSDAEVMKSRELHSEGWGIGELAKHYGVSQVTMSKWLNPEKPLTPITKNTKYYKIKKGEEIFEGTGLKEFAESQGLNYNSMLIGFRKNKNHEHKGYVLVNES